MNESEIGEIERQLEEIDRQIADLQRKREAVLFSDEEYAAYLEQYKAFYEDEPLSIREYYRLSQELDKINEEIMAAEKDEFENVWRKHNKRLAHLERMLVA